jgi:hypothetical protein
MITRGFAVSPQDGYSFQRSRCRGAKIPVLAGYDADVSGGVPPILTFIAFAAVKDRRRGMLT